MRRPQMCGKVGHMNKPPSPIRDQVAAAVDEAIKASGLTVNKVADLSRVPRSNIERSLDGIRPFTATELVLIGTALGTKGSALLAAAEQAAA